MERIEIDGITFALQESGDPTARPFVWGHGLTSSRAQEDAAGIFVSNAKWLGPFSKKVTSLRFCPVGDAQDMRWASMEP